MHRRSNGNCRTQTSYEKSKCNQSEKS